MEDKGHHSKMGISAGSDNLFRKLLTAGKCEPQSLDADWGQLLAPYLESALIHAGIYTTNEIENHMNFFLNHIALHLGPAPIVTKCNGQTRYKCLYPSSMTNDFTPFELSLCWKSANQEYKPVIRFVNDIVPSTAEKTRATSLTLSIQVIETLKRIAHNGNSSSTLQVLPDIWSRVSQALQSHETIAHPRGGCSHCGPSSTFIGFDLARTVISGKFYWLLPACQSTKAVLELMDKIFAACVLANDYFGSSVFLLSWRQIRNYIGSNDVVLRPRMLSVDATLFPAPRIKIYTRCLFSGKTAFEEWERYLNLDGAIIYPDDFRSTCSELWTSVATKPDEWNQSRHDSDPKYCLILYELTASSSPSSKSARLDRKLSSKLYIMCQEIPRKDSFIAGLLLRHCKLAAHAAILKEFANASEPTNFISEIGLAPRKEGTEVSIYLNPSFFSRHAWEAAEDNYMSKYRINVET